MLIPRGLDKVWTKLVCTGLEDCNRAVIWRLYQVQGTALTHVNKDGVGL